MPYIIKKFKDGYKVCKRDDKKVCFSNNPIPLERAKKQLKAIGMNEHKGGKINKDKIKISKELKMISKSQAIKDYDKLKNIDCKEINLNSNVGNKMLDYYFFPYRLDTLSRKKINFYDFLDNFDKIEKLKTYKNFYNYSKDNKNDINIKYDYFRLYFGSINQFKPIIAKYIYCKYNPSSIIDISAGWGGRMLGAITINDLKYTGFDTNTELKKPYENIIKDLNVEDRIKIIFEDSSKVDYSKYDYDMVFTSPPYYDIETYENMPNYSTKELFNNNFLIPVITNSFKHLKNDGYYILNIPIEMYDDVIKIIGKCDEKIKLPIKKRMHEKTKYKEYIYIWKKTQNKDLEGNGKTELKKILDNNDISINKYLKIAKERAKEKGYDPSLLSMSNKKTKKLNYNGVDFGSSSNNDFIIYSLLEKQGDISKGDADKHRKSYLSRATKIKGNWKKDKESPNNLAINILW